MARDSGGKEWLIELTQSITGQLKQNREDISTLWEQVRLAKDMHVVCREHILTEISKIDKRVEIVIVKLSVYVAIATFLITLLVEFAAKHWGVH